MAKPKDPPMTEIELARAHEMLLRGEITQSDLAWLMWLEQDEEDRPPPRGFKSWRHFNSFKWHMERKAKGLAPIKRRKRTA